MAQKSFSLPSPTLGWNAKDNIANMPPGYAVTLDNVWPQTGYCISRRGSTAFATCGDQGLPVESIFPYTITEHQRLFAASGAEIYDITSGGVSPPIAGITPRTNSRNFYYLYPGATGEGHLFVMNGSDVPIMYNHATGWADVSFTSTDPGFSLPFINRMCAYNGSLVFSCQGVEIFYAPPNAISGAVSVLSIGSLLKFGGKIASINTWSRDGGSGPADNLCIVTDQGEVVIYRGTLGSTTDPITLVSIIKLSKPIGDQCTLKLGADLYIVTSSGVESLGASLQAVQDSNTSNTVSNNIVNAFSIATVTYGDNIGWQLFQYPNENWVLVNVPIISNLLQHQYVMNSVNGSWCRFIGMNANCWALYGEKPYFGGNDGKVYAADVGYEDSGTPIYCQVVTAFSNFGSPNQKRFNFVRTNFQSDSSIYGNVDIDINYEFPQIGAYDHFPNTSGSVWGTAKWGSAKWAANSGLLSPVIYVSAIAYAAAVHAYFFTYTSQIGVYNFDGTYEEGGFL